MLSWPQAYIAIDNFYESFTTVGWWADPYSHFRKLFLLHSAFYRAATNILEEKWILQGKGLERFIRELKGEKQTLASEIWMMKNGEMDQRRMSTFIKYVCSCVDDIMSEWIVNDAWELEYSEVE